MNNAMLLTDGYKLDHRRQYPEGTECVYANWTPRSSEHLHEANCKVFERPPKRMLQDATFLSLMTCVTEVAHLLVLRQNCAS